MNKLVDGGYLINKQIAMQTAPYLIILAALLWSADGLLRRYLYSLPPASVVFLEHLLGLIVLLPLFLRQIKNLKNLGGKTWGAVVAIAALAGAGGTLAYTTALGQVQYINFSVVVLLQQLQPVFAIALAALLLREKVNKNFIGLAVLALAAAYFVSFPDLRVNLASGGGNLIAALLALGAAFCWGSGTVLGRYALSRLNFISLSGLRFAFTAFFTFLILAGTGDLGALGTLGARQWWAIIAIVFSTGLVALLIYYKGLSRVPARVSTLLELAWPVSAIIIDFLVFKNRLSLTQWLGAVVLIYVIIKISRSANLRRESAPITQKES